MADLFDEVQGTKSPIVKDLFDDAQATNAPNPAAPDFIPGVQRGLQNLQASAYGATALAGKGLKELGAESVGQSVQDFGMEGYKRNIEEAKQYPAKYSFKDVYTGKAGLGGTVDYVQGTLGELVPSMVEAGVGAAVGSLVAPGVGTAAGGLAARTVLKKGIEKGIEQTLKSGVSNLAGDQLKKQITGQALKKLGGKVGLGLAVMPTESGSTYGDLLIEKGVDAPGTALFAGAVKTAIEFAGGNSKLVDTFVDALSKGATGTLKKTAKELLTNIPQESLQEGSQGLVDILATVANTDEKLLTVKNLEEIVASMAAGAIGGSAGAGVNAIFSGQAKEGKLKTDQEIALDRRAANILNFDKDQFSESTKKLSDDIKSNQELLSDLNKLQAKAKEVNIEPSELFRKITVDNNNNQSLLDKINSGIKAKEDLAKKEYEKLSPEDKAVKDFENKLIAQQQADAQKINTDLETINKREDLALKQYNEEADPEKKKLIADRVFNLRKEKNTLTDKQLQTQEVSQTPEFSDVKKSDEIRQEKETFYNNLWLGGVNKDAAESAKVFNEKSTEQQDILDKISTQIANTQDQQKKQELQKVYDGLFQTFEQDAQDSAKVFANTNLSQFDQIVKAKDKERLNKILESIVIEPDPQARQTMFEKMFMLPGVKDAAASAEVFAAQGEQDITNQRKQDLQRTMDMITKESDPAVRQKLYNQMFQQPGVKNAQESAQVFEGKISELDQQEAARKQVEGEKFYTDLFAQEKPSNEVITKSAEESAKAFEQAGIANGQTSSFTNEQQVPLTDQQQIIVDKNNFQIVKLKEQYNTEIDRDKRINFLNQIDALEKDNATIRTSVEQFPEVYEAPQIQSDENQTTVKQETSLDNILSQVKSAEGITGQLANFISDFIPESKLDIKVIIDPSARSASYVGGNVNTITLRDASQLTSSIHEITHAVTVREMIANPAMRDQVKLLMERVKNKAIKEAIITPAQVDLLNTESTSRGYKENILGNVKYDSVAYGLLNENEFLAQAMGNEQFQELLKATTIADKGVLRNAWDAFVEVVMKALGIKGTDKNAFGETLSIIAKLTQQENMNQTDQTVNESLEVEQRLPQAEYDAINTEKNNFLKDLVQQGRMKYHEIKLLADKALGSISTRLKNVDPELSEHLRWLDFKTSQKIIDVLKTAKPILDATKEMSPEDKSAWNWSRLNSDDGKIKQLAQKYNLSNNLITLREKLNQIRADAISVGYDVGFIDEYWPRVIKDQEGFLQATQEISQRPVFTEAIRDAAKKLGITQEQFERDFPEVKADIISNLILGKPSGIAGPGNIQARVFETIPKEYAKFYMDADAALMQYVYSMTKKIEARKFFGKVPQRISDLKSANKRKNAELIKLTQLADMSRAENPERLPEYEEKITSLNEDITRIEQELNKSKQQRDYTENIGAYIDEMRLAGRIAKKDEKTVKDILMARFNEHGTTGIVNAYKNLSYIDTMGSPLSAITQIGDLAWAMYVGKVWTPSGFLGTGKNLAKAISGSFKTTKRLYGGSEVTKEDLGIERIAQEFADGTTLSKAVNKVFKFVQLERIDSIGKEVLINNALDQYKVEAKKDPEALAKKIRPTFGDKSLDVVQEILADNPSANVKMLLYSKLLDFQPVALSEMPEFYLNSGNGRVFYMLKTYTLKQMDVFRKEVIHNLKSDNPQQKIQGITNMVQLMALLTLANAGADEIKDFMLNKESRFSDNVIDNLLTMGGASRYTRMQVSKEGFGSALAQQILPPMKFINSASKDLNESYKNYVSGDVSTFDHARIIDSIPGLGKLYYWHYGRGEENKKSLAEQDFSKATKDADLFKKQLENSTDKRTFIESNLNRFKQMKVQENYQAALNRNKAVINKLEKIPSTENVQTRLGQLKAQREQILKKYVEVAKTIQ